jgi:hypothetical protein
MSSNEGFINGDLPRNEEREDVDPESGLPRYPRSKMGPSEAFRENMPKLVAVLMLVYLFLYMSGALTPAMQI